MKRILLISCTVILVCVSVIVGMTYALFTDSVTVQNHLKAGKLDVSLVRTNLKYSVLNEDGQLEEVELSGTDNEVDFTESTPENVFGLDGTNKKIVPGSFFEAKMKLENNGNVAFAYEVKLHFSDSANALSDQLQVTVTHPDGHTTTKTLSELSSAMTIAEGEMTASDDAQGFVVKISFPDLPNQNAAQNLTTAFDLSVSATQSTASAATD